MCFGWSWRSCELLAGSGLNLNEGGNRERSSSSAKMLLNSNISINYPLRKHTIPTSVARGTTIFYYFTHSHSHASSVGLHGAPSTTTSHHEPINTKADMSLWYIRRSTHGRGRASWHCSTSSLDGFWWSAHYACLSTHVWGELMDVMCGIWLVVQFRFAWCFRVVMR